jgi:hypothetical protein
MNLRILDCSFFIACIVITIFEMMDNTGLFIVFAQEPIRKGMII